MKPPVEEPGVRVAREVGRSRGEESSAPVRGVVERSAGSRGPPSSGANRAWSSVHPGTVGQPSAAPCLFPARRRGGRSGRSMAHPADQRTGGTPQRFLDGWSSRTAARITEPSPPTRGPPSEVPCRRARDGALAPRARTVDQPPSAGSSYTLTPSTKVPTTRASPMAPAPRSNRSRSITARSASLPTSSVPVTSSRWLT